MKNLGTPLHKATGTASLLYILTLLPAAYAGPITAAFQVVNTNADGSVITPSILFPGDSLSFDLTGGNNGSGLGGETDYIGTAQATGIVKFLWSYTSCFPPNQKPPSSACDSPGFDWAGYLVNRTLTQLTDTDTAGVAASASFPVSAGLLFGWYVGTFDNQGEPGTLTVSDISFTPTSSGIPEPGTLSLFMTGMAAVAAARRRINIQVQKGRKV
jgi:PEP-CTERM motif